MANEKSLKDNPEFIKDLNAARAEVQKLKKVEEDLFDAFCTKYNITGRPNDDIVWDYIFNEYDCLKNMR